MTRFMQLIVFVALCCSLSAAQAFVAPEEKHNVLRSDDNGRPASTRAIEGVMSSADILEKAEQVIFTADGSRVSSVRGRFAFERRESSEAAVRAFLLAHRSLFNLPDDRSMLEFSGDRSGGGSRQFNYQMRICDIPVEASEIAVYVGNDNEIVLINGSFPIVGEIANSISLDAAAAIAIAEKQLGLQKRRVNSSAERLIHVEENVGRVCYRVHVAAAQPLGDWELLIDAESGAEVSRRNLMRFYDGKGSTYVSHPLKCEPTVETLPDLIDGTLKGRYADIHNDETANAVSEDGTFVYPTHNLHFNEAMMYYLVNRVHAYFSGLGFDRLDSPMKAVVRYDVLYDNAFFSVLENALYFGDGYKFNDLAREESVCFHEYAHAARHQIVKLKYEGEAGAIDEGVADYFSASLSDDPIVGEFIVAKMNKPWLRNLSEAQHHYPESIVGQVHEDGKIWGCTLWDLRVRLGAATADRLVLNSLYYLSPDATFLHGLNALLLADENTSAGKNSAVIREVLAARGICEENSRRYIFSGRQIRQIIHFESLHNN
ncbi:MAG: hypothetical protein GQF41_0289 [Candidatus Rifleibacterium amylolyticum]|nr:MAG: hypothetical protein GQF41_0289 [Candidatus Rifleibacterium amylolyticum]